MTHLRPIVALAVAFALASATIAVAAQQRSTRASDQEVKDLLTRIDTRTDTFRDSFDRAIDHNTINGSREADQINRSVTDFEEATHRLRDRVNDHHSAAADAEEVLSRALLIESFMRRTRLDVSAEDDWQDLRQDLDQLAYVYGITPSWTFSRSMPVQADDELVAQLLKRIDNGADQFRKSIDISLDQSVLNGSTSEGIINHYITEFAETTDHLKDHLGRHQVVTNDIEDVLRRGVSIDDFVQRHRLSEQAENDWLRLRRDLDNLASTYHVAWDWSDPQYTTDGVGKGLYHRLTGTYQLESNQDDAASQKAETAARDVPADRRQAVYRSLMNRLVAPDVIAIDRNEHRVTMASSLAPGVAFEADGRARTERGSDGSTIRTRATLYGDRLLVATTGNWGNDYSATFEPMDDGRKLRLTRRIYDVALAQPVTVESFYRRSSNEAEWDLYTWTPGDLSNADSEAVHRPVPNGTHLVATLNDDLSSDKARKGDRFTVTISSPSQYQDAVILGFVTSVSGGGRLSGLSEMSLDFQSIRLRDGSSHDFDGAIESIRTPDGETIRVHDEGMVERDSRTGETVQRGAIGTGIGALIGAIAGGGNGAAIGAGGGASTVILDGRSRVELPRGTEVAILSGARSRQRLTTRLLR